jgi:Malate synthase
MQRVERSGLAVADVLADFVEREALPGTGLEAAAFWDAFAGIVRDLGYFGDQSLYRVRTKSGAILQVSAQNLRRSAKLTVEWDDEVFLSWEVGSTILLRS